jgi:hypothetical protein
MDESFPKNKNVEFRFGWREIIILVLGGLLTAACIFLPGLPGGWYPLRIGLAVLLGDITLVWALGRDPLSQATLESTFMLWIRKFFSTASGESPTPMLTDGSEESHALWPPYRRPTSPAAPLEINSLFLLQAISYGALAFLIAWLVTGGTQEIVRWLHFSWK